MKVFMDPSSICMVFHCQWWIKRAGSFLRISFTLTRTLSKSCGLSLFGFENRWVPSSVCLHGRPFTFSLYYSQEENYIYGLRFETHESVWPLFTSSPFVGLVFCIFFIAQTADYKADIKMYALGGPLKGDLNLVNYSHISTMKNCLKKVTNRSDDSLKALSIPVKC